MAGWAKAKARAMITRVEQQMTPAAASGAWETAVLHETALTDCTKLHRAAQRDCSKLHWTFCAALSCTKLHYSALNTKLLNTKLLNTKQLNTKLLNTKPHRETAVLQHDSNWLHYEEDRQHGNKRDSAVLGCGTYWLVCRYFAHNIHCTAPVEQQCKKPKWGGKHWPVLMPFAIVCKRK